MTCLHLDTLCPNRKQCKGQLSESFKAGQILVSARLGDEVSSQPLTRPDPINQYLQSTQQFTFLNLIVPCP